MSQEIPVEIYRASGELEAQVIRSKLEAAGIPSYFQNEALGTLGFITDGLGAFRIFVAPKDEAAARALLENDEGDT